MPGVVTSEPLAVAFKFGLAIANSWAASCAVSN